MCFCRDQSRRRSAYCQTFATCVTHTSFKARVVSHMGCMDTQGFSASEAFFLFPSVRISHRVTSSHRQERRPPTGRRKLTADSPHFCAEHSTLFLLTGLYPRVRSTQLPRSRATLAGRARFSFLFAFSRKRGNNIKCECREVALRGSRNFLWACAAQEGIGIVFK